MRRFSHGGFPAQRVQAQAMLDPYTGELLGAGASEELAKSLAMATTTDKRFQVTRRKLYHPM